MASVQNYHQHKQDFSYEAGGRTRQMHFTPDRPNYAGIRGFRISISMMVNCTVSHEQQNRVAM